MGTGLVSIKTSAARYLLAGLFIVAAALDFGLRFAASRRGSIAGFFLLYSIESRINAKKKFCANDVIPQYERYYQRVLESASAAKA